MAASLEVFLDSSAVFAAILSEDGGARMILKLGEAHAIRVLVSSQVLAEVEGALRRKAPESLPCLAMLLDAAHATVGLSAGKSEVRRLRDAVGHDGDAQVLADAHAAHAAYFVTLDRKHFLDNKSARKVASCPMGTPGECLTWLRDKLSASI